jgi:hypothetical protein
MSRYISRPIPPRGAGFTPAASTTTSGRGEQIFAVADRLARTFAERAAEHDREATFLHDNYADLAAASIPSDVRARGAGRVRRRPARSGRGPGADRVRGRIEALLPAKLIPPLGWPHPPLLQVGGSGPRARLGSGQRDEQTNRESLGRGRRAAADPAAGRKPGLGVRGRPSAGARSRSHSPTSSYSCSPSGPSPRCPPPRRAGRATSRPAPRAACEHGAPAHWRLQSTHQTSTGAVAYARCPCGALLVLLDGQPLAATHPRPRAATPPVPGEGPRSRDRGRLWLWDRGRALWKWTWRQRQRDWADPRRGWRRV